MEIVYGVQWIEREFGIRPEGFKIFTDLEACKVSSRKSVSEGTYSDGSGYLGPASLSYVIIPVECLEEYVRARLVTHPHAFSSNYWTPKMKSDPISF